MNTRVALGRLTLHKDAKTGALAEQVLWTEGFYIRSVLCDIGKRDCPAWRSAIERMRPPVADCGFVCENDFHVEDDSLQFLPAGGWWLNRT